MEFLIFIGVLAALAFWVVAIYNKLVTLKNRYENAFAQIEVQLKRRYDLIPNLVETAKGYMEHERGTLEAVTNARNTAMAGLEAASKAPGSADAMAELSKAEGALSGALGRLNIAVEAYPDLKASENMMQLSEELTSTEKTRLLSLDSRTTIKPPRTTPTSRRFHPWCLPICLAIRVMLDYLNLKTQPKFRQHPMYPLTSLNWAN